MKYRRYDAQFKIPAVELARQPGVQTQAVAAKRDICYDNAHVESFFGTLKAESDVTETELQESVSGLIRHIEDALQFYNRKRLHSALDFQPLAIFGKLAACTWPISPGQGHKSG